MPPVEEKAPEAAPSLPANDSNTTDSLSNRRVETVIGDTGLIVVEWWDGDIRIYTTVEPTWALINGAIDFLVPATRTVSEVVEIFDNDDVQQEEESLCVVEHAIDSSTDLGGLIDTSSTIQAVDTAIVALADETVAKKVELLCIEYTTNIESELASCHQLTSWSDTHARLASRVLKTWKKFAANKAAQRALEAEQLAFEEECKKAERKAYLAAMAAELERCLYAQKGTASYLKASKKTEFQDPTLLRLNDENYPVLPGRTSDELINMVVPTREENAYTGVPGLFTATGLHNSRRTQKRRMAREARKTKKPTYAAVVAGRHTSCLSRLPSVTGPSVMDIAESKELFGGKDMATLCRTTSLGIQSLRY